MNHLSEFQQRASAAAVVKMLHGKHFSICDLQAIAKTMGREQSLAGRDYAALQSLHCIDWVDMGPDLARMTIEKSLEILGLPPQTIEVVKPVSQEAKKHDEPSEKASRLRLAFWRRDGMQGSTT